MIPKFKHCPGCRILGRESFHPIEDFYEDLRKKDKHRTNCKQCDKERQKTHYANNKEKHLDKMKKYSTENKEITRSYQRQYQQKRRRQQKP